MFKDRFRTALLKLAASCNVTPGQMIFTTSGLIMLFASVNGFPLLFLVTLVLAVVLAWLLRHDLRTPWW